MRTLCPIKYAWVKDLLPQLHDIDVYKLSSCEGRGGARGRSETEGENEDMLLPPAVKRARRESGGKDEEDREAKLKERAASAKERYLARKAALTKQFQNS